MRFESEAEFIRELEKIEKGRVVFWADAHKRLYLEKMLSWLVSHPDYGIDKIPNLKVKIINMLNELEMQDVRIG